MTLIVHDEEQVKQFHRLFFGCLKTHECGYIFMAARKKYEPLLSCNLGCLDRKILQSNEDMTTALDSFNREYNQKNGMIVPDTARAYYATLNPRCTKAAASTLMKSMIDDFTTDQNNQKLFYKIPSQFLTLVHQNCARKLYKGLDVDDKTFLPEVMATLSVYNVEPVCIIETRGGYHVILNHASLGATSNNNGSLAHRKMTLGEFIHKVIVTWRRTGDKQAVEYMKDPNSPIPGTYQGGFPVRFV